MMAFLPEFPWSKLSATVGFADRQARQTGARSSHLAKGTETKVAPQAGPLQLAPADARQVAGDQAQEQSAARQSLE